MIDLLIAAGLWYAAIGAVIALGFEEHIGTRKAAGLGVLWPVMAARVTLRWWKETMRCTARHA